MVMLPNLNSSLPHDKRKAQKPLRKRVVNEKPIKTQPHYFTEGHLVWVHDALKASSSEDKFSPRWKGPFGLLNRVSRTL